MYFRCWIEVRATQRKHISHLFVLCKNINFLSRGHGNNVQMFSFCFLAKWNSKPWKCQTDLRHAICTEKRSGRHMISAHLLPPLLDKWCSDVVAKQTRLTDKPPVMCQRNKNTSWFVLFKNLQAKYSFYRTRVRSLAMLVSDSLTNSLKFSKLD